MLMCYDIFGVFLSHLTFVRHLTVAFHISDPLHILYRFITTDLIYDLRLMWCVGSYFFF